MVDGFEFFSKIKAIYAKAPSNIRYRCSFDQRCLVFCGNFRRGLFQIQFWWKKDIRGVEPSGQLFLYSPSAFNLLYELLDGNIFKRTSREGEFANIAFKISYKFLDFFI